MRKFALCLALILACTWFLIPVHAAETVLTEDFESYEVNSPLLTGLDVTFADGNWVSNAARMRADGLGKFGISRGERYDLGWTADEHHLDTNALALETAASWNEWQYFPTIANTKLTMRTDESYTITTDMYIGHYVVGSAIKLFAHNRDASGVAQNFYMLYFPGENVPVDDPIGRGCRLIKYENGVTEYLYTDPNTAPIQQLQWYTLTLTYEEGRFAWTCAPRDGGTGRSFSGTAVDPEPFQNVTAPFEYAAGGQNELFVYFDNLQIETYDLYVDKNTEKSSVLYADVSKSPDSNHVMEFKTAYRVRKLENPSMAGQTAQIAFSNDGTDWSATTEITFDADGVWLNNYTAQQWTYLRLEDVTDAADTVVWAEVRPEDTVYIYTNSSRRFALRQDGQDTDFAFELSDGSLAEAEDGVITGLRDGSMVVTAVADGRAYQVNVRILGEMSEAIENNTEAEYVAAKKPILDAMNAAIRTQDAAAMLAVLDGSGSAVISDILDFDYSQLEALGTEKLARLAEGLLDGEEFPCETIDDVRAMMTTVTQAIQVFALDNLADTQAVEAVITENNDIFGLQLDNAFYLDNQEETLNQFVNTTFNSVQQVRRAFEEGYVTAALQKAMSYGRVGEIVTGCAEEIGYDQTRFADLDDPSALYRELLSAKGGLDTLEKIRAFIDEYEEEDNPGNSNRPSGGNGGGGGGGGFVGGSGTTAPAIVVDRETAAEALATPAPAALYSDVPAAHWAYDDIAYLTAKNIVGGDEGRFLPEDRVTCAEFIKMLINAFEFEVLQEGENFIDVDEESWYADYMRSAKAIGMLNGDEQNRSYPDDPLERERAATILLRAFQLKQLSPPRVSEPILFTDSDAISEWAFQAVTRLQTAGIISGMEDGSFRPQATLTRAEAAKLVSSSLRMEVTDKEAGNEDENEEEETVASGDGTDADV